MTQPVNPWRDGPLGGDLWISDADRARIDRFNARLAPDDPTAVRYRTQQGRPLVPGAWSGDPWSAPILLLLLNPAVSDGTDPLYSDPAASRVAAVARGDWDLEYPNAWLHPDVRRHEPWTSRVVCGALHRLLVADGMQAEAAWGRLSRKVAMLELSPWVSHKWSPGAVVGTTPLSVALAARAAADPGRIVLLGRGESTWKMCGLFDADTLPLSRGVRSNQSRITQPNFPMMWQGIVDEVMRP